MSMPFESVAPDEHVIASALFRCRRPGETLWHDAPGFLTNYRVAAYDQNGFVFNIFFRRLARAEMRKTTWQGPQRVTGRNEITVDYGPTHHEGRLACRCGAAGCVGWL